MFSWQIYIAKLIPHSHFFFFKYNCKQNGYQRVNDHKVSGATIK